MSYDVDFAHTFGTLTRRAGSIFRGAAESLWPARDGARATSLRKITHAFSQPKVDGSDIAIVVAHPDDETIGCGALLSHLTDATVVLVTDGAPLNGADARNAGFESPAAYGEARARELRSALAIAGVDEGRIVEFGLSDQHVCRFLAPLARRLAALFESAGIRTVLTHAFEGGHPDHDGVAFCVHAATALLGRNAPDVIEMPYYHLGVDGMAIQRFDDGENGIVVELTEPDSRVKARMLSSHATQPLAQIGFGFRVERYRSAKAHDFRSLPNDGRILYSTFDSGFEAQRWPETASEALSSLGL